MRLLARVLAVLALLIPASALAGTTNLLNLACMTTATTGTGTVTLGTAVSGFLTFANAGAVDGSVYSYGIEDGTNSEVGRGTYTASGTTFARTSILNSTNGGSAISLTGNAKVCITPSAGDYIGASNWFLSLSANQTGADSLTAQTWFPGGGATQVTVPAGVSYYFEGKLQMTRSAGSNAHTISTLFAGTATFTSISYIAESTVTNSVAAVSATRADVATNTVVTGSNSSTTESNIITIRGIMRVNAGGTVIPQFQYNTSNPGGAPTIGANTYFRMMPLGSGTVLNYGPWS